jgi:hypothetical protein
MNARKTVVTDGFLIYSFWKSSFVVEHAKRKLQQDQQNFRKFKLEGALKKKGRQISVARSLCCLAMHNNNKNGCKSYIKPTTTQHCH